MTRAEIEQLIRKLYAARVAGNVEAMMAWAAPDVHFALAGDPTASPVAGQVSGADKLRPQLTQLVQAFTFHSYDITALVVEGSPRSRRSSSSPGRLGPCSGR
jgi:ketosteroid isomerase-like protein